MPRRPLLRVLRVWRVDPRRERRSTGPFRGTTREAASPMQRWRGRGSVLGRPGAVVVDEPSLGSGGDALIPHGRSSLEWMWVVWRNHYPVGARTGSVWP